jgi:uncharacterized protein DUF3768
MDIYTEDETALAVARIRQLNDEVRMYLPDGLIVISHGIAGLPADEIADILARVRTFDTFTSDNGPYGEHDFGSFEFGDERIFWRIDYYDRDGEHYGSPDPSDPRVTKRVLTVMLADEY